MSEGKQKIVITLVGVSMGCPVAAFSFKNTAASVYYAPKIVLALVDHNTPIRSQFLNTKERNHTARSDP